MHSREDISPPCHRLSISRHEGSAKRSSKLSVGSSGAMVPSKSISSSHVELLLSRKSLNHRRRYYPRQPSSRLSLSVQVGWDIAHSGNTTTKDLRTDQMAPMATCGFWRASTCRDTP